jgi:hypothetical protein
MSKPRGIRNCNPGNIRKTDTKWKGEVPGGDGAFETFVSMPYGYRALIKLMQNYQRNHRLKSIRQLISRWAPSSENNTEAYIATVARETGFGRDQSIDMKDRRTAMLMAAAISFVENGVKADMNDVMRGWDLL